MSTDLGTAITKLSEALEKFYPLAEMYVSILHQRQGEAMSGMAKSETAIPTTKKEEESGGGGEDKKKSSLEMIKESAKVGYDSLMSFIRAGESTTAFQMGTKGPAERVLGEINSLSKHGIYLPDQEAENMAGSIAVEQQAVRSNLKKLRPMINFGLMGNIEQKAGEMYSDLENDVVEGSGGTFNSVKNTVKKLIKDLNVDAFGR